MTHVNQVAVKEEAISRKQCLEVLVEVSVAATKETEAEVTMAIIKKTMVDRRSLNICLGLLKISRQITRCTKTRTVSHKLSNRMKAPNKLRSLKLKKSLKTCLEELMTMQ